MPRAIDTILVHEREPASSDDLEVVARDRAAPPGFLDPPAVTHLHDLAPAVPADRPDRALGIQLHVDRGVLAQEARHRAASTGRHAQRISGSGASASMT